MLEPRQSTALVGAFPPYMRELRRRNQPFKVLELDPTTIKAEELPYGEMARTLSLLARQRLSRIGFVTDSGND
ncbi:MAG: DUF364 domain-containing protein [Betaproteobacteria bacterium]|nr:DUF364 domain-containing protein [Betaproteobacteria bacterium]